MHNEIKQLTVEELTNIESAMNAIYQQSAKVPFKIVQQCANHEPWARFNFHSMTNQSLQRLQRAAWSTPRGKCSVSARDLSALIYAWAKLQEKQAGKFKSAISKPNSTQ